MKTLAKIVSALDAVLQYLLIALMALLVLDVCWQVITRFILADPSSYTEEIARFTLIWLALLGAASAYRRRLHLGIDVVVQRLGESKRLVVDLITHCLVALFAFLILIYGGTKLVMLTLQLGQVSGVMGIKIGWVYMALPLSGICFLLFSLAFVLEKLMPSGSPDTSDAKSVE